ncbi:SCP1 [Candida oxycetoniae]|uniref:SCP1 n=1 Tax=Candida oxycetoniae TaxID=497107 RepID=A0AAI9WZD8_9ASCO|nr:SCP1 [Candida oxycetoniae]KAI3406296.1 SCP1 [Candida oxycetoniae]
MPNKNPTLNFKSSSMAFIQMENISWFLKLCEIINLPQDEIFQTVDLFESKDPYQVCITLMSFSRIVHEMNPQTFTMVIGPKRVRKKPVIPNKPRALRS